MIQAIAAFALLATAQRPMHIAVGSEAPAIKGTTTEGKSFDLAQSRAKGNSFVLFWKERCPHNPIASSLFNNLAKAYGPDLRFTGVVTASEEGAKTWVKRFEVAYPMINDAEKAIVKSYQLRASICTFEISPDGKVVAVYPGYGATELESLNKAMAASLKKDVAEVDLKLAPKALTWG